jgi:hypothetical protein
MTTPQSNPATGDIASVIQHVKALQEEKAKLLRELEEYKLNDSEKAKLLTMTQQELSKFKEEKKSEMQNSYENGIKKWFEEVIKDQELRKQMEQGMTRLVDQAKPDGVFAVMVEASNAYMHKIQELEKLKEENETLRGKVTPEFRDDSSRKRSRDDAVPAPESTGFNMWEEFEKGMIGANYVPPI